jgi:protoporphyrinogen IX oxidase
MNDSRKVVVPCFSSLSRCLSVMTAVRLAGPGLVPGPFSLKRSSALDNHGMGSGYLWVKAFHIVFVASWFAGLFYLPRLFVNLAMVAPDSHAERERLLLMGRKLYRFAGILMLPALVLGAVLWLGYGVGLGTSQGWMHAKLALVLAVLGYHHACGRLLRRFEQSANRRSERWYRVFNECSVLLFAAIVVLVVVKPF